MVFETNYKSRLLRQIKASLLLQPPESWGSGVHGHRKLQSMGMCAMLLLIRSSELGKGNVALVCKENSL